MRQSLLIGAAMLGLGLFGEAHAVTVTDPVGDFIASYIGPPQPDLDVTSFSVSYIASTASFLIQSTMAGTIDPALGGFYAIGVNTGTGTGPFAAIGQPNVLFNQVISVQKNGTGAVSGVAGGPLAAGSVVIGDMALSAVVPLSLLPSTGYSPLQYGFNIWPRSAATGGSAVISDFAPDNATLALQAVPEPASWALMVLGFGATGAALRRRGAGHPRRA